MDAVLTRKLNKINCFVQETSIPKSFLTGLAGCRCITYTETDYLPTGWVDVKPGPRERIEGLNSSYVMNLFFSHKHTWNFAYFNRRSTAFYTNNHKSYFPPFTYPSPTITPYPTHVNLLTFPFSHVWWRIDYCTCPSEQLYKSSRSLHSALERTNTTTIVFLIQTCE